MRNEFKPSELRLRVTLCDPRDHARELPVHYRIFDLPIARRWSDLVVFLSQNNSYLYDPERFYNFPGDPKADKSWVHAELEWCISRINRFVPGHVDVRPSADMDQDVLNELHERFADGLEDLVDVEAIEAMKRSDRPLASYSDLVRDHESWQRFVSDVREHAGLEAGDHSFRRVFAALNGHPRFGEVAWTFYLAFNPVGAPLERLNKAIHRWEDVCAVRQHETQSGHEGWKYMCVNFFPFACIHMQDEDFRHFTIEDRFGRVYLDDMTAGKCIWDVYRDRDEHIVAEHYKSLGYYWGDFRIYMGPSHEASWTEERMARFWEWFAENEAMLAERGFRRDDPRLTIGSLPVADLEPAGVLAGLDPTALVEEMSRYQRVKRVEIVDDADRPLTSSRFGASQGGWDQVLCTFGETAGAAGVYAG